MPIAAQSIETLEFPKVREQLAGSTAFSASRELALALLPSSDPAVVRSNLAATSEARDLLDEFPDITVGGIRDIRSPVQRAKRGGVLDGPTFLEIAGSAAAARQLRIRLLKLDRERFPWLTEQAGFLPVLQALEDTILRTIGDDGAVLDSASPELSRLRREIRIAFGRLQEKLQSLISSSQYAGALQESIITMRNGRYVVPVKAGQRREIRGLVHDQSGSGATLYIEPLATVELNNRWRELQSAEEEEVNRILSALSDQVGAVGDQLMGAVETMAEIDLAFAKGRYSQRMRGVKPEIEKLGDWEINTAKSANLPISQSPNLQSPLLLTQARHPLLDQSRVVPIDLYLGGEFRLLLITGPNTGGKTVALKTAGLLAIMAQSGLHIPAEQPSRLPVFEHIFADIGDEQSIEQSLSTFSSHMTNIIRILRALEDDPIDPELFSADKYHLLSEQRPPALVLFDELGAGTDPVEGAALARAIIERLLELEVLGVATTHYAELKAYAYNTPGVQNGSVEFNVETLAPTYKLTIGLPGRSNALAIAGRLGLDPALIERARSTVAREDAQIEDLLAGIHRERSAAEAELRRSEQLREDAERYRDRLAVELRELQESRDAQLEQARRELDDELREVRSQLRRLRDDFQSVSLSRQWLEEAEQRTLEAQAKVKDVAARPKAAPAVPSTPAPQAPRPLQPGDRVLVRSVGLQGEIVSLDEDDATALVQVGGFRMRADLAELRREKSSPEEEKRERNLASRAISTPPPSDVSMTFDMRGWRASEVNDKLDRYLNDAYLAGLAQVRLIHGKGTGALRQVVRDLLQGHPLVASFASGGQDGGDGVTVAKMVER
jgi:DNA mismatch repair protein MutS2